MFDDSGDYFYKPYYISSHQSSTDNLNRLTMTASSARKDKISTVPTTVEHVILNLKLKYKYPELLEFVQELTCPKNELKTTNREFSILQLYTLHLLNDPIDMSSQSEKKIYRPKLFLRKNDELSPFNHYYLLNLFNIEYECPNQGQFPDLWKTNNDTKVTVAVFSCELQPSDRPEANETENDTSTLIDLLRAVCQENNYDEATANKWLECLKSKLLSFRYTLNRSQFFLSGKY